MTTETRTKRWHLIDGPVFSTIITLFISYLIKQFIKLNDTLTILELNKYSSKDQQTWTTNAFHTNPKGENRIIYRLKIRQVFFKPRNK